MTARRYRYRDRFDGKDDKPSTAKAVSVVALVILFLCVRSCLHSEGKPNNGSAKTDLRQDAYYAAQLYVEDFLRAPATADYPYYSERFVSVLGDNKYRVSAYVDSENGFGAKIRSSFVCTLRYENDNWVLIDGVDFR